MIKHKMSEILEAKTSWKDVLDKLAVSKISRVGESYIQSFFETILDQDLESQWHFAVWSRWLAPNPFGQHWIYKLGMIKALWKVANRVDVPGLTSGSLLALREHAFLSKHTQDELFQNTSFWPQMASIMENSTLAGQLHALAFLQSIIARNHFAFIESDVLQLYPSMLVQIIKLMLMLTPVLAFEAEILDEKSAIEIEALDVKSTDMERSLNYIKRPVGFGHENGTNCFRLWIAALIRRKEETQVQRILSTPGFIECCHKFICYPAVFDPVPATSAPEYSAEALAACFTPSILEKEPYCQSMEEKVASYTYQSFKKITERLPNFVVEVAETCIAITNKRLLYQFSQCSERFITLGFPATGPTKPDSRKIYNDIVENWLGRINPTFSLLVAASAYPETARQMAPFFRVKGSFWFLFQRMINKRDPEDFASRFAYQLDKKNRWGVRDHGSHFCVTLQAPIVDATLIILRRLLNQRLISENDFREFVCSATSETGFVARRANAMKQEGNSLFAEKDFVSAAFFYTYAILMSPPNNPELKVYYSNRSQCHLHLGNATHALEDAKHALRLAPDCRKSLLRKEAAEKLIRLDEKGEGRPA